MMPEATKTETSDFLETTKLVKFPVMSRCHWTLSNSGGWDRTTEECPNDFSTEIDQTFDSIKHAIRQAGRKGWGQVYKTRIYITVPIDEIAERIIRNMKDICKKHGPLMTVVQVVALYKTMKIETEAEAYSYMFIVQHTSWRLGHRSDTSPMRCETCG